MIARHSVSFLAGDNIEPGFSLWTRFSKGQEGGIVCVYFIERELPILKEGIR